MDIHPLTSQIIRWYREKGRELPWRQTCDPYLIWLSEVMLQQTRVEQALPYFHKFSKRYPDVAALAAAEPDEVMQLWQGLGYYSRANNMLRCAREVVRKYDSQFPADLKKLQALPGIGEYTAAAIAAFAFKLPYPAIDGNLNRLICRLFGIEEPLHTAAAKKQIRQAAAELIEGAPADEFNQAMMDFGSGQCTAKKPRCENCPLSPYCRAFAEKKAHLIPLRAKKSRIRERWLYFLVLNQKQGMLIEKRSNSGIWRNLYQFPLLDYDRAAQEEELFGAIAQQAGIAHFSIKNISQEYTHLLTHRKLHVFFVELQGQATADSTRKFVPPDEIGQYGFPVVVSRYLRAIGFGL